MRPIGGYFELELAQRNSYHPTAIALNTGRNCLEYILRVRGYSRVYIPYYTCDVILEPFKKLGINYTFYHINLNLEIGDDITLGANEALLYTNYFGLKQDYTATLASKYGKQLIVDNTQAFFAKPFAGIDTFYTCRKFFGVADGAYLYCDQPLDMKLEQDHSWNRMDYLLKRIDLSPEDGYADFQSNELLLSNLPIRRMSALTERIMASIDYDSVAQHRRDNYIILDDSLRSTNNIELPLTDEAIPMVYPYLTEDSDLRQKLIDNKIFVAKYWPNVQEWTNSIDSVESFFTNKLLPLPVDQRYGTDEWIKLKHLLNHESCTHRWHRNSNSYC